MAIIKVNMPVRCWYIRWRWRLRRDGWYDWKISELDAGPDLPG